MLLAGLAHNFPEIIHIKASIDCKQCKCVCVCVVVSHRVWLCFGWFFVALRRICIYIRICILLCYPFRVAVKTEWNRKIWQIFLLSAAINNRFLWGVVVLWRVVVFGLALCLYIYSKKLIKLHIHILAECYVRHSFYLET